MYALQNILQRLMLESDLGLRSLQRSAFAGGESDKHAYYKSLLRAGRGADIFSSRLKAAKDFARKSRRTMRQFFAEPLNPHTDSVMLELQQDFLFYMDAHNELARAVKGLPRKENTEHGEYWVAKTVRPFQRILSELINHITYIIKDIDVLVDVFIDQKERDEIVAGLRRELEWWASDMYILKKIGS